MHQQNCEVFLSPNHGGNSGYCLLNDQGSRSAHSTAYNFKQNLQDLKALKEWRGKKEKWKFPDREKMEEEDLLSLNMNQEKNLHMHNGSFFSVKAWGKVHRYYIY